MSSEMYSPEDLCSGLDQTFKRSALGDFQQYLAQRPNVKKWIISSDYCLHDKSKPNDVFAYSIFPYDTEFSSLQEEVRSVSPKDLKNISSVNDAMLQYLADERRFHMCFLVRNTDRLFSESGGNRINSIRESISETLRQLKSWTNAETHRDAIKRFNELDQYAKKKGFDAGLIEDMYLASLFASYIGLQLVVESGATIIGWFSDRDKITTTASGVVYDWFHFNLHGLIESRQSPDLMPNIVTAVVNPTRNAVGGIWYDDLIRVPDFFAGAFASWNLEENLVPGDKPKYKQIATSVIADHSSLVLLQVQFGDGEMACSRRVAEQKADTGELRV
jgi:hypothetical protein